jgi:ribosomal protein S27E
MVNEREPRVGDIRRTGRINMIYVECPVCHNNRWTPVNASSNTKRLCNGCQPKLVRF